VRLIGDNGRVNLIRCAAKILEIAMVEYIIIAVVLAALASAEKVLT
jgi:hypothetical protein